MSDELTIKELEEAVETAMKLGIPFDSLVMFDGVFLQDMTKVELKALKDRLEGK